MNNVDMLVTGVGGQGVILASDMIGEVALATGYDVKKTDTLGMAQRGGSVISNVRIGQKVWSPLIRDAGVDILVAFEKLEAARWVDYLRPGAVAIVNNYALPPLSVNLGNERYPSDEEIAGILRQRAGRIYFINGTESAKNLGNVRTLNMYMLGCASLLLAFDVQMWKDCMSRRIRANVLQINTAAYDLGRKEGLDVDIR